MKVLNHLEKLGKEKDYRAKRSSPVKPLIRLLAMRFRNKGNLLGWESLSYIRYFEFEDSSSYLFIFYLSSGQERSDRGDGRGEEVSTIAMTGKRKTRKETTAALAGKSEIATLLIDLHGHG